MEELLRRWAGLTPEQRETFAASLSSDGRQRWFEQQWVAQCRSDFTTWCVEALRPHNLTPARHHRFICSKLQAVANGEISRLMLFCPPGSAKTTYSSRLFPAWFFQNHPGAHIIGASHTTTLAEQLSGDVQKLVVENQHILDYRPLSERRDLWTCSNGCMYLAAGAGVGIAGFRADMAIIDDPIRSRADADSETLRDKVWRWYLSDVLPRLKPNGRVIVILTRWHEDDLVGRLLETQREQWTVVELPALAGEGDALGREPGGPLWCDDGYGYGQELLQKREQYERDGALRDWEALYQQRPRPPMGAIFDCT